MESDDDLRARVVKEWERQFGPPPIDIHIGAGKALDSYAAYVSLNRQSSSDPFGDAIRAAQAKDDADPAVIPYPIQPVPAEDRDALWRSIEDYGRGG